MSVQLKNVKVKFISILTDDLLPANGKEVIVKSKKGEEDNIEIFAKLEKFEDIKGWLYITPMVSIEKDADDEYYVNETIEETAHNTLKNAIKKEENVDNPVDTNHINIQSDDVYLVESHIDKSEDKWVWKAVLDISENEELMRKAKDGKINGVSIAGTCVKVPDVEKKIKTFEQLIEKYSNIEKDFNIVLEDMKNTELYLPADVFWRVTRDDYYEFDTDEFKKRFKKNLKQLSKYVDSMTFEKITKSGGEKMKDEKILEEIEKTVDVKLDEKLSTLKEDLIKELKPVIPPAEGDEKETVSKEQYEELEKKFDAYVEKTDESLENLKKSDVLKKEGLENELQKAKEEVSKLEKALTSNKELPDEPDKKPIKKAKTDKKSASEMAL